MFPFRAVVKARHYATAQLPTTINDIFKNPPPFHSPLNVQGWVKSVRVQKKIAFVDLADGTSHHSLTCVAPPELAQGLQTGSSVQIQGLFVPSKGKQDFELKIPDNVKDDVQDGQFSLKVLGKVPASYPLQKKTHTLQFLRTLPHLRWKTNTLSSILRLRSHTESLLADFFNQEGFTKTSPPLITSSDCEGAGELFTLESASKVGSQDKFFGKNAYLTVSTQLHLETLCMALTRVWTLSPCFRAEESDTNRHLSEFWMMELELAFVTDVHQLTRFCERMIKHVVRLLVSNDGHSADVLKSRRDNSAKISARWASLLLKDQWDNITYTEAIEILQRAEAEGQLKFHYKPQWGNALQSEHEKWLAGEYFQGPVAVTDYPKLLKPFYMKLNPDNKTVACFDLLVPDMGELIGGSMREHDLDTLQAEMVLRNMDLHEMLWYLSTRENGSVPHGGFGMGFERLVCYLGDVENIKDVIPFPRYSESCSC